MVLHSTVTVFYDPTSTCNTGCQVASGGGGVSLPGPISAGRYYIRISATGNYSSSATRTNLNVSKTAGAQQ
jgi:hypothetical protein